MSLTKNEMVEIYKQFPAQQATHATAPSTDPGRAKPKLVWVTAMVVAFLHNRCDSHDHPLKGPKSAKQLSRTWGKIAFAINLDCDQSVTKVPQAQDIEYATICKDLAKTGNSSSSVVEPPSWSDLQSWLAAKSGMGNVEYAALKSTEEGARNRTINPGFDSDTEHDNVDSIEQDIEEADGGMMPTSSKRTANVERRQGRSRLPARKRSQEDVHGSIYCFVG
ncbi:hypothetical protein H257_16753 [Aphanomyces astaci]|uniref:Uncharacterized protein n=1 Tax=Aphanomyces astaci TaxID=112090 RepID=W4FJN2_APHAT|nr:hypothetical protein H257_16753 [Aphanomyces astaci]ETV66953.1 hypothetical protein H257_16753 [Aphanomyces astaci]|eukprot:XP_009843594.1 hypothetical protein H257_16753 [Aphanomyces astaci]